MVQLNTLFDKEGARPSKKRVGRGLGSGKGKTAGRGTKGQKARTGTSGVRTFEGGQTPLYRRLAKVGFFNIFAKKFTEMNIGKIEKAIEGKRLNADKIIDLAALKAARLITKAEGQLKILGEGKLSKAVKIEAAKWSKSAEAAIAKAGGSIVAPGKKKESAAKVEKEESAPKKEKPAAKKPAKAKTEKPAAKKPAKKKTEKK
ncbi:MAG: 50S ribosomal protein L15 [Rickettsiales bacterium]|jgi:large subunit ribosomal protein L15|nr:50S ribosomal protein L15 [Rickettsiales bacterium]